MTRGFPTGAVPLLALLLLPCVSAGQTYTVDVRPVLNDLDVKIETVVADQPAPADWRPPYGLVAVRKLAANTELRADMACVAVYRLQHA